MSLKPWREVIFPHEDVREGMFQQAEFAADLSAVHDGRAGREYGEPQAFFERTFITWGMANLLTQVVKRLNDKGGEPVIQLQTAFGGGKTHTMLAVYHLVTRDCPLAELAGISALVESAQVLDVPRARVVVLDGTAHSPGQAWRHDGRETKTLWGELARQLGGEEGYALVRESDEKGTSPGKEALRALLARYSPSVILLDELVVYIRQFGEGLWLSGGSYESNLSFIQALTEAAKLVPQAVVLASLPESNSQAGGPRGIAALQALEAIFNRVQALWKTVAPEEAFEIVRRRLFEPIRDAHAREEVCRAFAETYAATGSRFPVETRESRYLDLMIASYPIHPEVFAQLYESWSTIEGFQRTRGVLKLLAKVVCRLWRDNNKDLMILPGSLPLHDPESRNELTYYLGQGWDAVIDRDIDGERAETISLEKKEPRFGMVQAARRVARTIFLGSAPASVATKPGIRGIERSKILLGCAQPEQIPSLYSDALNRLADRLHYMSSSGDKQSDSTFYWFDTRANLRREMEERKGRFADTEVQSRIADVLKKISNGNTFFDGVHIFTPHQDVPDDESLRLIVLPPDQFYAKEDPRRAKDQSETFIRNHGTKPRYRGNRLIFLAPDFASIRHVTDCIRAALAWKSIVDDVKANRLVLDNLQTQTAQKELINAEAALPQAARECWKWILCPVQENPTSSTPDVEVLPLDTRDGTLNRQIEKVCLENEWVIAVWSPVHLTTELKKYYWKEHNPAVRAMSFWEDSLRYVYFPPSEKQTGPGKGRQNGCRFQGLLRHSLRISRRKVRRLQARRLEHPTGRHPAPHRASGGPSL